MKGSFGKYKAFLKTGLLDVLAYKFNVFSWLFVSAVSLICLFFLWSAVYSNSPDAVINGFNKRNDIDKSKVFMNCSVLLVISNIIIYSLFKFKIWDLILLSTIPVIMLRIIKTDKEKQKIIDINTKKTIDEYFKNKK